MMQAMLLALAATVVQPSASGVEVWLDDMHAVTYSARIEGDWLVVEAVHQPGWHTYAMDNVIRARDKTGQAEPETEIPTAITPLEGLTVDEEWRQSPPVDLSTPEIRWYTWGFEGKSFFAAPVGEATLPASIQIDGQACTESLCAWVDALEVPVAPDVAKDGASVDPESLVVVASDDPE
jgi:hypothetical protein